jgi:hypothetical protein
MSKDKFFESEECKQQYLKAEQEIVNGETYEENSWDIIKAIFKSFLPTVDS